MSWINRIMVPAIFAAAAAAPCQAFAKSVVAYLLFEITGSDTAEKLKSTSLSNCKQLLVGSAEANELIFHLLCDERDGNSKSTYTNQAVLELAQVQGVRRATVLVIRTEGQ